MRFKKSLTCIDMHTAGEAARIVTSGLPSIPGTTIAEKKIYLQKYMDHLRCGVMLEPRGHNDMFGAFLLPPVTPGADVGIIFLDTGGYLNMCGHNSIAAATAVVETGMIPIPSRSNNNNNNNNNTVTEIPLVLDTPAGLVHTISTLTSPGSSEVSHVTIINVPSFLYLSNHTVQLPPPYGEVTCDIAFGGSFFAIVAVAQLGLHISLENISQLQEVGDILRSVINNTLHIQHPLLPHINKVDCVEFYGPPTNSKANCKNVVIFGNRQVDRSPCGTGTSAKMATLHAKGELSIGESFVYESILGTLFYGKLLEEKRVEGARVPANTNTNTNNNNNNNNNNNSSEEGMIVVTPQISGSAYITGFNTLLFDERDPFCDGFTLKA